MAFCLILDLGKKRPDSFLKQNDENAAVDGMGMDFNP
jgi:hypothetical protein